VSIEIVWMIGASWIEDAFLVADLRVFLRRRYAVARAAAPGG